MRRRLIGHVVGRLVSLGSGLVPVSAEPHASVYTTSNLGGLHGGLSPRVPARTWLESGWLHCTASFSSLGLWTTFGKAHR